MSEQRGSASSRRESLVLTGIGLLCGFASSAAFFLHVLGLLPMPFLVNFAALPIIVLMLIVGIYSRNRNLPFWMRFRAGLLGGLTGIIAYDVVRYAITRSVLLDYHPFHAIVILGSLITGMDRSAPASVAAGWTYHVWNGFSFAVIYALIAGGARWYWGVAWAMVLEAGMLLSYPTFLAVQAQWKFVVVSVIGHSCYGVALGMTVERAMHPRRSA